MSRHKEMSLAFILHATYKSFAFSHLHWNLKCCGYSVKSSGMKPKWGTKHGESLGSDSEPRCWNPSLSSFGSYSLPFLHRSPISWNLFLPSMVGKIESDWYFILNFFLSWAWNKTLKNKTFFPPALLHYPPMK